MPGTDLRISGEQRDALYALIVNHLSGVEDVNLMLSSGDFETAERLGREFAEDLRMLDDLGYAAEDGRETVRLTMPREELAGALRRLRADAEGCGSEEERAEREREEEMENLFRLAASTCRELIAKLQSGREPA